MSRPSILLVEPSESIRTTVASFLEAHLFNVETARSDDEAIRMLNGYAVVIVDVSLERGQGLRLLGHIATHRPALVPRIVIITADDPERVGASLREAGICEIVPKPIRSEEILAAVQDCLQAASAEVH